MGLPLNPDGTIPYEIWSTLTVRSQIAIAVGLMNKGNYSPILKMLPSYLDPGRDFRQKTKIYFKVRKGADSENVRLEDYVVVWYNRNSTSWTTTELIEFANMRISELKKYYNEYRAIQAAWTSDPK